MWGFIGSVSWCGDRAPSDDDALGSDVSLNLTIAALSPSAAEVDRVNYLKVRPLWVRSNG